MNILISKEGILSMLYTEEIDINAFGKPIIQRASHVEPDENGNWWADMSPINGEKLGAFKTRSEALKAEVEWLEKNKL